MKWFRIGPISNEERGSMRNPMHLWAGFRQLTTGMAQSVAPLAALKEFAASFAGLALACLMSLPALSQTGAIPAPSGLVAWWSGDGFHHRVSILRCRRRERGIYVSDRMIRV